jgi:hypothetical protein
MLGWDSILLHEVNDNDETALNLFWQEWDEFVQTQKADSGE